MLTCIGRCLTHIMFSPEWILLSCQRCLVCRDLIAQFVSNTFPGPIYPGYAERLAAGKFEVTPSSPGFPVSGVCLSSNRMLYKHSCYHTGLWRTCNMNFHDESVQTLCMSRGVQITFHQSLLNGNVTAITANLLLGSWNKVICAFCVSFHFIRNGQNRPKCAKIRENNRFCQGGWGEFGKIQTCKPVETAKSLV